MSAASRDKGRRGETELARVLQMLTDAPIRRRVRQHDGDSDLEGLPGWSVECKRRSAPPTPSELSAWWQQAVRQAAPEGLRPLLCWRADRQRDWTFTWPAGLHNPNSPYPGALADTLSADPLTWWRMACRLPPPTPTQP